MELLPAFILFAAIAAFTPGPNNIMIMSSGLNFGIRASIPHLFGIAFGVPVMFSAVGFGAVVLFERFPYLHLGIKLIGLSYLIYLAYRIAMSAPGAMESGRSKPLSFLEAALFQWVNPKAWMMGTSAIAGYTKVGADLTTQIVLIVLVFFLMTWPAAGAWLVFGAGLKRLLANVLHQRVFNWAMAILLILSMRGVISELFESYFG